MVAGTWAVSQTGVLVLVAVAVAVDVAAVVAVAAAAMYGGRWKDGAGLQTAMAPEGRVGVAATGSVSGPYMRTSDSSHALTWVWQ